MTRFRSLALTLFLAAFANVPLLAQNESIIVEAESGVVGSQFPILNDAGDRNTRRSSARSAAETRRRNDRVITFTVTFPSAGTYELYAQAARRAGHVQRRQLLLRQRLRREEPGRRRRLDSGQRPRGARRVHAPERQGRGRRAGAEQRLEMGEALGVRRRRTAGRGIRGAAGSARRRRSRLRDAKTALARQVRVRPPGRLLHRVRPRQRPAGHDRPAAAAVRAAGSAHRDRQAQVPRRRLESLAGPQLHGVLEPGDARERRQVGQRRRHARRHELGASSTPPTPSRRRTASRSGCTRSSGATSSRRGSSRCRPRNSCEEIQEWFAAVAARYPDIDFIDVVNEPLHDPPDGPGNGNYIDALGGSRRVRLGVGPRVVPTGAPVLPDGAAGHQRVQRHQQHRPTCSATSASFTC